MNTSDDDNTIEPTLSDTVPPKQEDRRQAERRQTNRREESDPRSNQENNQDSKKISDTTHNPLVLKAINLGKAYKGRKVVKDACFEVQPGQVVGLLGPNGAGKTTSFYMVVGLVKPDHGQVLMGNKNITAWPMHKRAQQGIAYLPQEASVFRRMTAEENIQAVLETMPITQAERQQRLHKLLDEFNINTIAHQKAYTLSGGERRRVEVARALALNPVFLLLDEPFAGIDPIAVTDIQRMIQVLKKRGIGVLITDHNVRETLEICDLGYLLNDGKIIEKGTPQEIAGSRTARETYLGEKFQF